MNGIQNASVFFNNIHGIVNVFKPSGLKWLNIKNAILHNICKDLNDLQSYQNKQLDSGERLLYINDNVPSSLKENSNNLILENEILCTGPYYGIEDFRCHLVSHLGKHASGVLLFGIGNGVRQSKQLQYNKQLRVYDVTAQLGIATENHFPDSRITVKAKYRHIRPERISYLASSMQASHQRKLYEICGVDLQSQAAYEIASKGLLRPTGSTEPIIYSLKLVQFTPPHFTLRIHAINETEDYLAALIHDMAIELRTVAHCTGVRCIRHGHYIINSALLRHNWTLNGVLQNIEEHKNVILQHKASAFAELPTKSTEHKTT